MCSFGQAQRGAVLIISLLILLLIGVLATGAYESNVLQMRMAGNEQQRSELRQQALAMVDTILAHRGNFVSRGGIGHRRCADGAVAADCDEYSLVVQRGQVPWAAQWDYAVIRRGPLTLDLPAMGEARASSGRHYRAALYEISVSRQGDDQGRGRMAVAQGVLLPQPRGQGVIEVSP